VKSEFGMSVCRLPGWVVADAVVPVLADPYGVGIVLCQGESGSGASLGAATVAV
jgi:hypothetical protein